MEGNDVMLYAVVLWLIGLFIFSTGLWAWARGGDTLWQMFTLKRKEKTLSEEEKEDAEREVRRLARRTDRALGLSLRILTSLLLIVWLALGVSIIMELMGFGWLNKLSMRAYVYWNGQANPDSKQSSPQRNNVLRNLGVNMRK